MSNPHENIPSQQQTYREGFSRGNASSRLNSMGQMSEHQFKTQNLVKVKLPLTAEQRYFHFRAMMWQYGRMLISQDDYHYSARPKKMFCTFLIGWTLAASGVRYQYNLNPEPVYKRFVLKPWGALFALSLPLSVGWYLRKQKEVYHEIYERTVGHLSDRELLELEQKLNPSKKMIYDSLIVDAKEKDKVPFQTEQELQKEQNKKSE